MACEFPVAAKS